MSFSESNVICLLVNAMLISMNLFGLTSMIFFLDFLFLSHFDCPVNNFRLLPLLMF